MYDNKQNTGELFSDSTSDSLKQCKVNTSNSANFETSLKLVGLDNLGNTCYM